MTRDNSSEDWVGLHQNKPCPSLLQHVIAELSPEPMPILFAYFCAESKCTFILMVQGLISSSQSIAVGHKPSYRCHPSNAIPTCCQGKKTVQSSLMIYLFSSEQLVWWCERTFRRCIPFLLKSVLWLWSGILLGPLVLLLVLRCICMPTEAALAVGLHYIFCSTCCKLLLSWTVNLFLFGKERFNKKIAKNMIPLPQQFVSCSKSRFTGKQITDCCL